jgi:hypothetical protein
VGFGFCPDNSVWVSGHVIITGYNTATGEKGGVDLDVGVAYERQYDDPQGRNSCGGHLVSTTVGIPKNH